jgi:guanosine-3',5'-bis(diphosphate) 3'-pyrophosphohydrolase
MEQLVSSELIRAISKAAWLHRMQRRKGSQRIPYINHSIRVAEYLTQCGFNDLILLQAAVLHDVAEDTEYTIEEMRSDFGVEVASIVEEVTDDMNFPSTKRKELQVIGAASLSVEAAKIRIADKSCNISDLLTYELSWSVNRKLAYVEWSERVVDNIFKPEPCLLNKFKDQVKQARLILSNS